MTDSKKPDDLELQPPTPRKKRARATERPPEDLSPTVRVEQAFQAAFAKRYGCPMVGPGVGTLLYNPPRDRKVLKHVIDEVGEAETLALIHDFFFRFEKDRDIRFRTRRGNVLDFKDCLPRLLLLRNGINVDTPDRIADNDREIDRARGRK